VCGTILMVATGIKKAATEMDRIVDVRKDREI
jgi:hypothetical protein